MHANCAVWSAEVYEECSGLLRDVHTAISRGTRLVSVCVCVCVCVCCECGLINLSYEGLAHTGAIIHSMGIVSCKHKEIVIACITQH